MMNPVVEWKDINNQRFLFMSFDGKLFGEDAEQAISTIPALLLGHEGKITLVWECTHMSNYDTVAREAWQSYIKEIKPRIEAVHLISNRMLIRTGAMVVGVFAGIKVIMWDSLDEFLAKV